MATKKTETKNELTKDELSLLLYLETRAVDQSGIVDTKHINETDFEIAHRWDKQGFITFKRWTQRDSLGDIKQLTYITTLSNEAWVAVAQERQARAKRLYEKTTENR